MPLQRIDFACLVIAVKFTEKDDLVPLVEVMLKFAKIELSYQAYQRQELQIMQLLGWHLLKPTIQSFADNYSVQGLMFSSDPIVH